MVSVVVVAAPAAKAGEHTRDIATIATAATTHRVLVCLTEKMWQPRNPDKVWTGLFGRMAKSPGEPGIEAWNAVE
jgi:hypothetical protein